MIYQQTHPKLTRADFGKANGLKGYIDWAAKEGFGIIDINVPKHLTGLGVILLSAIS